MFGSVVLEVGGGLILTFLLFSIILTSVQEGIESLLKGRARDLERAIGELLDKGVDATIVKQFYEHPMIYPLFEGAYKAGGRNLPSYIPKANFAAAVSDLANKIPHAAPGSQASASTPTPTQRITDAYQVANQLTGGGAATALQGLEAWYDSAMERLTGQYKRKTQVWLFGLGFAAAAIGNIDPVFIGDQLAKDQKLRADVVALAPVIQEQVKSIVQTQTGPTKPSDSTPKETVRQIQEKLEAGLPVGWEGRNVLDALANDWPNHIVGWVIAAFAGMLGAPFWFDLLNRIMNLRAALKPDTKKKA